MAKAENSRMKEHYLKKVVPALQQEFGYKNVMEAPRVNKVSLNIGLGEAVANAKALESATGFMNVTGH